MWEEFQCLCLQSCSYNVERVQAARLATGHSPIGKGTLIIWGRLVIKMLLQTRKNRSDLALADEYHHLSLLSTIMHLLIGKSQALHCARLWQKHARNTCHISLKECQLVNVLIRNSPTHIPNWATSQPFNIYNHAHKIQADIHKGCDSVSSRKWWECVFKI